MKKSLFVIFLSVVLATPLFGDSIVTGSISISGFGNASITLPTLIQGCGNDGGSGAAGWVNGTTGFYSAIADVTQNCATGPDAASIGVDALWWDSYISGTIPVPLTLTYQNSVPYISGSWTVQGPVTGGYSYWDGPNHSHTTYYFSGLATYNFSVDGPISNPGIYFDMSFETSAPSPVPEPSTLVLLVPGIFGAASLARRKLKRD